MRISSCLIVVLAASVVASNLCSAQTYPTKSIRLITTPIGGGGDVAARIIAPAISSALGQTIIIDNRPTNTVGELGAVAAADGYTLIVQGAPLWVSALMRKVPYDPVKDFAPISLVATIPLVLFTSLPVQSVKDLIAMAKAKPGDLNNSRGATGGAAHLAGELFKTMAGVKIVEVPYTNQANELADLVSGRVQLTFTGAAALMDQVKAGRLKAIAVTSLQRSTLLPGLPAVAESLPGFEVLQVVAILAPAKTPQPIVKRLNEEIVRVLKAPDVKEKFFNIGVEPAPGTPEELGVRIKSDLATFGKVVRDAGIKIQ